jgi:hypothetical protein
MRDYHRVMVSDVRVASEVGVPTPPSGGSGRRASFAAADVFMRRLLRVDTVDPQAAAGAHRAFRWSILVTAVRCTILYMVVPILVPIVSVARVVAVPVSIALCMFALVNGVVSVRRFWIANHPARWKYLAFMGVVFAVLLVSIVIDITRLVSR